MLAGVKAVPVATVGELDVIGVGGMILSVLGVVGSSAVVVYCSSPMVVAGGAIGLCPSLSG